jgi:hypothetical protein
MTDVIFSLYLLVDVYWIIRPVLRFGNDVDYVTFSNNVRKTRSAALEATDGTAAVAHLGRHDQNFTFADLRPMSVEFIECSAAGQNGETGSQLDDLVNWLTRLA